MRLVLLNLKMNVWNESSRNLKLEEFFFKVNKKHVGQKHYMALTSKKKDISLYINLIIIP